MIGPCVLCVSELQSSLTCCVVHAEPCKSEINNAFYGMNQKALALAHANQEYQDAQQMDQAAQQVVDTATGQFVLHLLFMVPLTPTASGDHDHVHRGSPRGAVAQFKHFAAKARKRQQTKAAEIRVREAAQARLVREGGRPAQNPRPPGSSASSQQQQQQQAAVAAMKQAAVAAMKRLETQIAALQPHKQAAVEREDYGAAAVFKRQIMALQTQLQQLSQPQRQASQQGRTPAHQAQDAQSRHMQVHSCRFTCSLHARVHFAYCATTRIVSSRLEGVGLCCLPPFVRRSQINR